MNGKLFINYRREDTAPYAGRLYDRLTAHFGEGQVFIDIDQIEPGEDFVEAISRKVGTCDVAIVAIGPSWLRATDASGKRRLDDEEDFVRMEIVAALQRKIRVIPVLVGGARMPGKHDLPEALAPLSRRNAIELSETRFHADVNRLIEAIEKALVVVEEKAEQFPTQVAPPRLVSERIQQNSGSTAKAPTTPVKSIQMTPASAPVASIPSITAPKEPAVWTPKRLIIVTAVGTTAVLLLVFLILVVKKESEGRRPREMVQGLATSPSPLAVRGPIAPPEPSVATAVTPTIINGAGATFPYPIYSKWFDDYAKVDPSVRFNYQSIGSGGGQKQILAQTVDFGASDGPMSDQNLVKAPGKILHLPTVAGAVVMTYNIAGNPSLKLDADTTAGIFLGQIKNWNDPKLTGLNPETKLPDQEIVVVHRSDGSGTTFIFTDYLRKISGEWEQKVGNNTSVNWPTGIGGKGNEGVSHQVKQTPGAIGYVEMIYALQNKMPFAEIKNAAGQFIKPTIESVTAALATINIPDDFRFSMTNAPGNNAYPIAGATWLLVYEQQTDAVKGKKLVEFLKWALSNGGGIAKDLNYAPLPDNVQQRVLKRLDEIKLFESR